jgi:MFS family permease
MTWRAKIGLYGSYLLSMASIGFTLPYLPLYLRQSGLSARQIGMISMLAAVSGLAQFPIGVWSDRLGQRKAFLVAATAALAVAVWLLPDAHQPFWLGLLVILFAENGINRAVIESLSGAEAAARVQTGRVGTALGVLRFCKPVGIVTVALGVGWVSESHGIGWALRPMLVLHAAALGCALLLPRSIRAAANSVAALRQQAAASDPPDPRIWRDRSLCVFVLAMVLFHFANAPGGVYLGLFLKQDLLASDRLLSYAFVTSMVAWMLVVVPGGKLADRWGTRPMLILGWAAMAARLGLVAVAQNAWQIVAIQFLDGFANGLFAVLSAAWVTERLNNARRVGEAQAIVGTSLVLGSALGPAFSGWVVEWLGYRGMFGLLAVVGALATLIIAGFVPESVARPVAAENALPDDPQGTLAEPVLPG